MQIIKIKLIFHILLLLSITLGSFSDEATQVALTLKLNGMSHSNEIAMLFIALLLGGIVSSNFANLFFRHINIKNIIIYIFYIQAFIIFMSSFSSNILSMVIISFSLGFLGSMLWAVILTVLPGYFKEFKELERANKIIQTIRNLGYVIGPATAGIIFSKFENKTFHIIGVFTLFSALILSYLLVSGKVFSENISNEHKTKNHKNGFRNTLALFKISNIRNALFPLFFTIIFTSVLNVLLVIYVNNIIHLGNEKYGYIVSSMSVGLIISPILLSDYFLKLGRASGSSLAASIIGLGLILISLASNFWYLLAIGLLIGLANGIQNTLMSSFMMATIPASKREEYMPAYILFIQFSVLLGFTISYYIKFSYITEFLLFSGIITVFFGCVGFLINKKNH